MAHLLLVIAPHRREGWDTRDAVIAASPGAAAAAYDSFGAALHEWRGWLRAVKPPLPGMWVWEGHLELRGETRLDHEVLVGPHAWRPAAMMELVDVMVGRLPWPGSEADAGGERPIPLSADVALHDGARARRRGERRREPPDLPRHLAVVWLAGWDAAGREGEVVAFPGRVIDLTVGGDRS